MIHVQALDKSYGTVHAVRNLSFDVPAGELFCFLGPNGAGKTTTIKMLTGLLRPDRGVIRIGGYDIATDPVAAKTLMGYIPDMAGSTPIRSPTGCWSKSRRRKSWTSAPHWRASRWRGSAWPAGTSWLSWDALARRFASHPWKRRPRRGRMASSSHRTRQRVILMRLNADG